MRPLAAVVPCRPPADCTGLSSLAVAGGVQAAGRLSTGVWAVAAVLPGKRNGCSRETRDRIMAAARCRTVQIGWIVVIVQQTPTGMRLRNGPLVTTGRTAAGLAAPAAVAAFLTAADAHAVGLPPLPAARLPVCRDDRRTIVTTAAGGRGSDRDTAFHDSRSTRCGSEPIPTRQSCIRQYLPVCVCAETRFRPPFPPPEISTCILIAKLGLPWGFF